jgi:hypothetical protein
LTSSSLNGLTTAVTSFMTSPFDGPLKGDINPETLR